MKRLAILILLFGAVSEKESQQTAGAVSATAVSIADVDALEFDRAGNLYISGIECIFKIDKRGTITRLAGVGIYDDSPDGTPAINARIRTAFSDLAIDSAGNIYFSSPAANRIRQVSSAGVLTTIAGTGTAGYSGDGGPATQAQINGPHGIALDAAGNLYFADSGNYRIRKVSKNGFITTVAGSGVAQRTGDGGPALAAGFEAPRALRIDAAGNLHVSDGNGNVVIRRISPAGTIIRVAGTASPGKPQPDGGPATDMPLGGPVQLALGRDGLYIFEQRAARVRKVSPSGIITTVRNPQLPAAAPGGIKLSDQLTAIALDDEGRLYLADKVNRRVFRVAGNDSLTAVAGNGVFSFSGDGGPALSAQFDAPIDVAVDKADNIYIADLGNSRIRVVSRAGTITTFAGPDQDFGTLRSIAVDNAGNVVFAAGYGTIGRVARNGAITKIVSGEPGFGGDGGPAVQAKIYSPSGLAFDSAGNLYFADTCNSRVRKISTTGIITTVAGVAKSDTRDGWSQAACFATRKYSGDGGPAVQAELSNPTGVAVDASGNIFIADTGSNRIRKVTRDGVITTVAGNGEAGGSGDGGPATKAQLQMPSYLVVDASGTFYISGGYDGLRRVFPNGSIDRIVSPIGQVVSHSTADWFYAEGIAFDNAGNLLVATGLGKRIGKVSPDGKLTAIAGTGSLVPPQLLPPTGP